MIARALVPVAVGVLFACSRSEAPSASRDSGPDAPAVISRVERLTVKSEEASWGTVGIVAKPQPAWVAGVVEVHAPPSPTALGLESVVLLDGHDSVVATGTSEIEVRVVPPDRPRSDFSAQGTTPFDGKLAPRQVVRLRVGARLDRSYDELTQRSPVRWRVIFSSESATLTVDGPLSGPWPTA